MMNKRQAERLAKKISVDDPQCRVEAIRDWGTGYFDLRVIDTRTGIQFIVHDSANWTERRKLAELYGATS
jgi:hypothetical protein